jgi:Peptidase family M28
MAVLRTIHYGAGVTMSMCFQRYWPRVSILVAAAGCAPSPAGAPPAAPQQVGSAHEPQRLARAAVRLAPMTQAELETERQLRVDVAEVLSAGERHTSNDWGLSVVTDNLAARLEALDLAVDREGFVGKDGALGQNLIVNLRGSQPTPEVVMLGARFDSVPGSPGADDNASGVAALLAVARAIKDKPRQRSLQLVWFSDASGRQVPESMGAWQRLEHVNKRRLDEPAEEQAPPSLFRACIEVHGLGVYSEAPNSQGVAPGMPPGHTIGEFVEVASLAQDSALGGELASAMGRSSSVAIKGVTWLEPEPTQTMTAFRAYADHQCPAVLVSDTQKRRFAAFGTPEDTLERLDFARLARAVNALIGGVDVLLNAPSVNSLPLASSPTSTAIPAPAGPPPGAASVPPAVPDSR